MALDEPKESDSVYDVDGFKYVVDKEFMKDIEPVKVEFMEYGFKVSGKIEFGSGCGGGSCSTESSCGTENTCCS
ncbi:MAG: hypothetical protein GY749_39165 [Desulfobacteraceae bacterium]|nr:hypothetical protein [Desulfobacteraceae bacterium]